MKYKMSCIKLKVHSERNMITKRKTIFSQDKIVIQKVTHLTWYFIHVRNIIVGKLKKAYFSQLKPSYIKL